MVATLHIVEVKHKLMVSGHIYLSNDLDLDLFTNIGLQMYFYKSL